MLESCELSKQEGLDSVEAKRQELMEKRNHMIFYAYVLSEGFDKEKTRINKIIHSNPIDNDALELSVKRMEELRVRIDRNDARISLINDKINNKLYI